jgi:hypothetical protein
MMDNLYIFPGSSEGEVPRFDLGGELQRRIMLVLSRICRYFVPVDWIVGAPKIHMLAQLLTFQYFIDSQAN